MCLQIAEPYDTEFGISQIISLITVKILKIQTPENCCNYS